MLVAGLSIAPVALWPARAAQAQGRRGEIEDQVKAAFIYKFAGYVDWPSNAFARAGTPLTIAVMGAEGIAAQLAQAVTGRTVNDRPMTVKQLKPGESLDGVHILFVGQAETAQLAQVAQSARRRSVLTVSESEGALAQGSVINFVLDDRRVRFEISLDAAEKSRLRLSSRLLAVARQVLTGTP